MALNRLFLNAIIFLLALVLNSSCKYYSFTGANISPDVKSISIETFVDKSGGGPATLSQFFSERLRDYYQRNTNLSVKTSGGDLQIEGSITGYTLAPLAPTAPAPGRPDIASQTRLTITVQVKYINTKDEDQNFEAPFSFYADFPQSTPLSSVQNQLIETITDQIALDIFNKTVANW